MTTYEIDRTTKILRNRTEANVQAGMTYAEGMKAAIARFVNEFPEVAFLYMAAIASRKANGVS